MDRLPRRTVRSGVQLWWVGAHGGAGETTLAQLRPGSEASGHAWPRPARGAGPDAAALPVMLVARTSWRGLTAAQQALTEWAAGTVEHVNLLGLVLVADAPGSLPPRLKELSALVAGGAPRLWRLPWVEAWRLGADVLEARAPREVRHLLEDLDQLTTSAPSGHNGKR